MGYGYGIRQARETQLKIVSGEGCEYIAARAYLSAEAITTELFERVNEGKKFFLKSIEQLRQHAFTVAQTL